jgi:cellulose synthase/poly-beta-1,6-N-acetylglucosamine synthase-like glycosyltransferase
VSLALAAATLLGFGLLGFALAVEERRREAPPLPPPLDAPPQTTVLLPVRDEEANVVPCIETLLASSARPRILVVDDGSTDATATLVATIAGREPRVTLLQAPPLPEGWRGKVHALATAEPEADTSWLLCVDADARQSPDLLSRAHAAAQENRLDLVSLGGQQEAVGLAENLLVPPVFALLDSLLGDWHEAARSEGPVVASGQFLLVRRAAWARCGGFAAIRDAALDDVEMARLLRQNGFRSGFLRAPGLRIRMYRGAREAFQGWRRNLGAFLGLRSWLLARVTALLLLPPLGLAWALATGHWLEAAILWTAGAASSMLVRLGGGTRAAYGLLYPCDSLFLAATLLLGSFDRRRGRLASWKGRTIEV